MNLKKFTMFFRKNINMLKLLVGVTALIIFPFCVQSNENANQIYGKSRTRVQGGLDAYRNVTIEVYMRHNLSAKVNFTPNKSEEPSHRPDSCVECISLVDGERPNMKCENAINDISESKSVCIPTADKPYCSVEYGLTGTGVKYVRRGCNSRLCHSCVSLFSITKCRPILCEICNDNKCNGRPYKDIFSSKWDGCNQDLKDKTATFSSYDSCKENSAKQVALSSIKMLFSCISIAFTFMKLK